MAGFLPRTAIAVLAMLALGACVAGPGGARSDAGLNPVTGGEIEVTALDDPAATAEVSGAKGGTVAAATATAATAPVPVPGSTRPRPRPQGLAAGPVAEGAAAGTAAEEAAPEVAPPVPEVEKSAAQITCERKKGIWSKAGKTGRICIFKTRDAGKVCKSARQCEGACLARSRTCAPIRPLLGCNEILDDMGRRMTLCLN